jgi:hypothetical protein
MDIASLSLGQLLALGLLVLVALLVIPIALKLLARATRVIFTIGCALLLLLLVGACLIWRLSAG